MLKNHGDSWFSCLCSKRNPGIMQYSDAVAFLQSFPDMERGTYSARVPTMSLDAMRSLLKRMGDPQTGRHTAHVTGSKGKGSTSTMLASILHEAGYKTALFTSPHLHSYTERIRFGLEPVSEEEFARGIEQIMPFVKEEHAAGSSISTFGVLTALFFHLVKEAEVDWQVVEVGMGGRFDATNVFDFKDLAIITPISLEHIEVLGTNQSEIASNKAGIITHGCATILAAQKDPAVRSVVGRKASEAGADMYYVPKVYTVKSEEHDLNGQTFRVEGSGNLPLELHTPLLGSHQMDNAITAMTAARIMAKRGFHIPDDSIVRGIANAKLPGRFDVHWSTPTNKPGEKLPVILDGAHNHESAAALAAGLKRFFPGKKFIYIVGVNKDKNINAIWRELLPLSKTVIATQSSNPRAMESDSLSEQMSFQSEENQVHPQSTKSVKDAIELARSIASADDAVCVTGSLYVVADAMDAIGN